ncbi:MAG: hypothetical protein ACK4MV_01730 [Beijerinckiaceae bacterium]
MSKQTMTLRAYQTLCERMCEVETIETDGLLILRGVAEGQGRSLALHPFASGRVTVIQPGSAPDPAHAPAGHSQSVANSTGAAKG